MLAIKISNNRDWIEIENIVYWVGLKSHKNTSCWSVIIEIVKLTKQNKTNLSNIERNIWKVKKYKQDIKRNGSRAYFDCNLYRPKYMENRIKIFIKLRSNNIKFLDRLEYALKYWREKLDEMNSL